MFVTFYSSFVNLDLCECMTKIIEFCAKQQSAQNTKVLEELSSERICVLILHKTAKV